MSAPPKPWERAANGSTMMPGASASSVPPCCQPGGGGPLDPLRQGPSLAASPPPLPTRPSQQTSAYGGYGNTGYGGAYGNSYGNSYGSYGGLSSYGGFGTGSMYSPYGGGMYGSSMYGGGGYGGMNRFGGGDMNNSFVQMAEENSRQAFQSIEGIVQAVGSVSMMLESTYSAVYNSFRAVIGVADHFSRMKTHFAQIFSALAIIRTLKWIIRKFLVLLRLREAVPHDELWAEAAEAGLSAAGQLPGGKKPSTSWPLLLFFAVIMGGPWLIWRFLSSLTSKQAQGTAWASGQEEHFVALAEHDFDGQREDELTFQRGQRINVAPKELQPRMRGWLMASVDGEKVGIIPANYVKILGKRPGTSEPSRALTPVNHTGPAPLPQPPPTGPAPLQALPTGPAPLQEAPPTNTKGGCCGGGAKTSSAPLSQATPPTTNTDPPKKGCCGGKKDTGSFFDGNFESAFSEVTPRNESFGGLGYGGGGVPGVGGPSVMEKDAGDILDSS